MTRASGPCVSRRGFLATGAALIGGSSGLGRRGSGTRGQTPRRSQDRPWIPPADLLERLPGLMELASVPGLSMAAVEAGAVRWTHAAGVAHAETRAPVTVDSVFPAASLGKPAFGYAVLRLVDEGRLDPDRPLVGYHRPDYLPADPRVDRITARHVLSHTSGFRNWRFQADQALTVDFEPGSRFSYSGEAYFWLGLVVEAVTGESVDRVVRSRLFDPAGMPRSTYAWTAEHDGWTVFGHGNRGALAQQFGRQLGQRLLPIAARSGKPFPDWRYEDVLRALPEADPNLTRLPNFLIPNVAGSLLTTAAEYARFLALMMAEERREPWQLREPTRRAMLAPQIELKPGLHWGLGWGLERTDAGSLFWHWGDNGSFKAFTVGHAERGRALVVFTNGQGGQKVYERMVRAALGRDLSAFLWV